MMFAIGGSARVKRTVKPKPQAWVCHCYSFEGGNQHASSWSSQVNPAYLTRCTTCGKARP